MKTETEFSFQTRAFCQDSYSRNSIKASFTLSNFVGDFVFLKDANELAHESIESLFRSAMSFACHSFHHIFQEEKNRRENRQCEPGLIVRESFLPFSF
jgi:hypothetical protein